MFDLDFENKDKVREYAKFRKYIISQGFSMMQFSVYIKFFTNFQEFNGCKNRIKLFVPLYGNVRFLCVTEKQFEKMEIINNRKNVNPENVPEQLLLL